MSITKRFIVGSLFALLGFTGISQNIEVRPQSGLSYGLLNPAPTGATVHGRLSWHAGADVILGERFILQTGVQYHQFRSAYTYPGNTGGRIDFVGERYRVPVNVGMRLLRASPKAKINIRLFGGAAAYYLTSVRSELSNANVKELTLSDVNPISGTFNYGVGVDFFRFFAEVSKETSFSNFFKNASIGNSKTESYVLNIGIRIRFKNRLMS